MSRLCALGWGRLRMLWRKSETSEATLQKLRTRPTRSERKPSRCQTRFLLWWRRLRQCCGERRATRRLPNTWRLRFNQKMGKAPTPPAPFSLLVLAKRVLCPDAFDRDTVLVFRCYLSERPKCTSASGGQYHRPGGACFRRTPGGLWAWGWGGRVRARSRSTRG